MGLRTHRNKRLRFGMHHQPNASVTMRCVRVFLKVRG
jgi:hypothetical protein